MNRAFFEATITKESVVSWSEKYLIIIIPVFVKHTFNLRIHIYNSKVQKGQKLVGGNPQYCSTLASEIEH